MHSLNLNQHLSRYNEGEDKILSQTGIILVDQIMEVVEDLGEAEVEVGIMVKTNMIKAVHLLHKMAVEPIGSLIHQLRLIKEIVVVAITNLVGILANVVEVQIGIMVEETAVVEVELTLTGPTTTSINEIITIITTMMMGLASIKTPAKLWKLRK
jgi:hypothetical protein